jgi:hypothetical protein
MPKHHKGRQKPILTEVPVEDLQLELERRKAFVRDLLRRYEHLVTESNRLRAEIEKHGGFGGPNALLPRPRPRNRSSLAAVLVQVLKGRELSVDELTRAVLETGYYSTSPNLKAIVHKTLLTSPQFKRVARGVYSVR